MRNAEAALRSAVGSVGLRSRFAAAARSTPLLLAATSALILMPHALADSYWTSPASGTWSDAGNWSGGAPNGVGTTANFFHDSLIGGPPTDDVVANLTETNQVGTLHFDDLGSGLAWGVSGSDLGLAGPSGNETPSLIVDGIIARANIYSLVNTQYGLTKSGTGTLSLQSQNSITAGVVSVVGGTLELAATKSLGSNNISASVGESGTMNRLGGSTTINAVTDLTVYGTVNGDGALIVRANVTGGGTGSISGAALSLQRGVSHDFSVDSGSLTVSAPLAPAAQAGWATGSGTASVTKSGAGTLVLSATNTYTGTTQINAGTLVLNGSLSTGAVTVAGGGRLEGTGNGTSTGKAAGPVAISGTIAPTTLGSIAGVLTTGAESWNSGGVYEVDLVSATKNTQTTHALAVANPVATNGDSDQLVVTSGGLTLSNGFSVIVTTAGNPTNFVADGSTLIYDWVIGRVTGGSAFDASTLNLQVNGFTGANVESYHFSLLTLADSSGLGGSSGKSDVVLRYDYSAVPEATTFLLGMVGLAPMLLHRRRNRGTADSVLAAPAC